MSDQKSEITEQLKQLTEVFSAPKAGEIPVAKTREELEILARAHNIHPGYIDGHLGHMDSHAERPRTALQTLEETRAEIIRRDELDTALAELECKLAIEKARISPLPPVVLTEEQAIAAGLDLLGKHAWSLKGLTDDVRDLSKALHGEQRANATLALRHLEDALHRMNLAKFSATKPNC